MDADAGNREDFAGAVRMLRRQRGVILATTLVIGLAALASALVAPSVYESSVEVVVEPVRFGAENAFASSTLVQQELATQRRIATSQRVAELVAEQLGDVDAQELLGAVTAEQLEQTRVLRIVARDGDAERAARIADGFAEAYLLSRRTEVDERLEDATADLQARAEEVRTRLTELQQQLADEDGAPRAALERERDSLLAQLGEISAQLTRLEASGAVARSGGEVIRDAVTPTAALSPDPLQRTALGLLVGLLLGLAVAWVREHGAELFGTGGSEDPAPSPVA